MTWSWLVAALGGGRGYLCAGSSSFDDPDVVEVTPAAAAAGGWSSGHQKRKRSQVMWEGASSISPLFVVHDFIIFFLVMLELGTVGGTGARDCSMWEGGLVIVLMVAC